MPLNRGPETEQLEWERLPLALELDEQSAVPFHLGLGIQAKLWGNPMAEKRDQLGEQAKELHRKQQQPVWKGTREARVQ